jgi:cytochrome c
MGRLTPAVFSFFLVAALCGCERKMPDHEAITGGNPARGRELIRTFGCGSCHTIPGMDDARATVAPPLDKVLDRVYIGGVVNNNAQNLERWIVDPRALNPKTAMPNVGATPEQARDIAAFLYSQR